MIPDSTQGNRPIKLLCLLKVADLGGAEMIALNFARFAEPGQFDLHFGFVVPRNRDFIQRIEALGVQCHDLSSGWFGESLWPFRLRRLLQSDFDVVHIHAPLPGAVARFWLRLRRGRRPIVATTEHCPSTGYHPLTRLVTRWTLPWDDIVISVSPNTTASLPTSLQPRVLTIPQGIPLQDFDEAAQSKIDRLSNDPRSVPTAATRIGVVANYKPEKDYPTLLSAFAAVHLSYPAAELHIAGIGTDGEELREMIEASGAGQAVRTYGPIIDVAGFLAAMDVVVIASDSEAGPLVALEAAASQCCIVSTDVGLVTSHFTNMVDASIVPPRAPTQLAQAIEAVIANPKLREQLASNARDLSRQFDAAAAAAEVRHVIQSAVRASIG